jgi:hypothetical protein
MFESCSLLFSVQEKIADQSLYNGQTDTINFEYARMFIQNITMRLKVRNQNIDHINETLDFLVQEHIGDEMAVFNGFPRHGAI